MTDLERLNFDGKQIFPDTTPRPKCQANIAPQTDGRISQTILKIQSYEAKRNFSTEISVNMFPASTPRT